MHLTSNKEKHQDFINKIANVLENYKDALFVLFPHDYRVYDALLSDKVMCQKIYDELTGRGLDVINAYDLQNEIDVKSVIGLCDLLITCRMHIAIASFSKNVPVISFVYQGKFEGLYAFYNFRHNLMFEKDSFDNDELKSAIDYLLNNNCTAIIKKRNKKILELSEKNFEFLSNKTDNYQDVMCVLNKYLYKEDLLCKQ